jgi:hypothetical protein
VRPTGYLLASNTFRVNQEDAGQSCFSTVYTDSSGMTPITQPVLTDNFGRGYFHVAEMRDQTE